MSFEDVWFQCKLKVCTGILYTIHVYATGWSS